MAQGMVGSTQTFEHQSLIHCTDLISEAPQKGANVSLKTAATTCRASSSMGHRENPILAQGSLGVNCSTYLVVKKLVSNLRI